MERDIMTLKEAAQFLGVSPWIVYSKMKDGLPYFQIRRYGIIRFSRTDLAQFLEENNRSSMWFDLTWRRIFERRFDRPFFNDQQRFPLQISSWARREVRKFLDSQKRA